MDEKTLEYSNDQINIWSGGPHEESENDITVEINGHKATLIGFNHVYKRDKLILSYKIKVKPLRFLYPIHDTSATNPLMAIKSISPGGCTFIEMKDFIKYHDEVVKDIEKAGVPLEQ